MARGRLSGSQKRKRSLTNFISQAPPSAIKSFGLLCFGIPDQSLQRRRIRAKFLRTSWRSIRLQDIGNNVQIALRSQAVRVTLRHRCANAVNQVANRATPKMGGEGARDQCRRRIFAGEVFHVATGAALVVQSLASSSLLGCEDPVLSRIGGHNQQLPIHPRMFLIDVSVGSWFVELERCLITGGDGAGRPRSILSRNRVALKSIVDP